MFVAWRILLCLCALFLPGCATDLHPYEYIRPKMGTGFRVVIYAPTKEAADSAAEAAYARIDQLNDRLSDYDPKSEISQLSLKTWEAPMSAPVPVSDDLWRILVASVDAARESDGAFDVTLGPCTRLWRRSRNLNELPTPERLAEARKSVGWEAIRLFPETHSVQLLKPKMRLDVGGIAKGYTSMEALAVIRQRGLPHAMVGAAGDLSVGEPPPGRTAYRVGVNSMERDDGPVDYVNLRNASVSTSGDTERFVIIDGKRYSHILDPKTGLGLTARIGASVIAPDGTLTDWMDTAICVMGVEKGLALVESTPGAAARMVTIDDAGKITVRESKRWREYRDETVNSTSVK
jgi:thiamine biosynthesis lipoprotein